MWTNASLPRPSATWMQIVSIPLDLFGADAGLVTKAMERIASVSSLWNCPFSQWRYLTTVTTGIHFVFSLSIPLRLKKEAITLTCIRKQKTTNWRILVVDGKWRHRAVFLNVLVGSFVTFYPRCNAHIIVWYFPFAADGTCDGVICDQNSACVPITLGGRDRQCVCLDGWSGDGRSCTGTK